MTDEFEDELDDEVNDIIAQIRNQSRKINEPPKERESLKKEDMEEFIITNAANVVKDSVEMVEKMKIEVLAGADSKLIESVSELVKATTSAIDALTKLKIAEDKIKSQKEIAQMNIENKSKGEDNEQKFYLSREEIIKALMNKNTEKKVIDI
jgi:hypothetical protein